MWSAVCMVLYIYIYISHTHFTSWQFPILCPKFWNAPFKKDMYFRMVNEIKMEVKRQMIYSIFLPTLCYQCQTWSLSSSHYRKLITCEMKCLRKAVGVTRLDRLRNEDIRQRIGIIPCIEYIERQQIKWFGHLMRMNHDQLPIKAYNQMRSGFRARGRPRKRWIDNIRDIFNKHSYSTTMATHLALELKLKLPPPPTLNGKRGQQAPSPPGERK